MTTTRRLCYDRQYLWAGRNALMNFLFRWLILKLSRDAFVRQSHSRVYIYTLFAGCFHDTFDAPSNLPRPSPECISARDAFVRSNIVVRISTLQESAIFRYWKESAISRCREERSEFLDTKEQPEFSDIDKNIHPMVWMHRFSDSVQYF